MCDVIDITNQWLQAVYDWMLILAVLSLVAVDIVIIIIYTAVEGSMGALQAQSIVNRENPRQEQGVRKTIGLETAYLCRGKVSGICTCI